MSINRTNAGTADPVVEDTGNLAKLVDRVVERHTPIVVARAGEPKAALVSMEDYARLRQEDQSVSQEKKLSREEWSRQAKQLREDILAYRGNKPIDLDKLIQEKQDELEDRDAYNSGT